MKQARILIVDDESNIRELLEEILVEEGYDVATAEDGDRARAAYSTESFDLVLLDIWMPDVDGITLLREWAQAGELVPVVMMSGHGTVDTAVEATRLGAIDYLEKPVSLAKLLRTVDKALEQRQASERRQSRLPPMVAPVGKSETMRALREQVAKIAHHDVNTLITGEPGSGREAFARYLASSSSRSSEPFVEITGGSLDASDGRRRLLGEPGAPGALEQAQGGTLFINELGDVSPEIQQLLLGVVEDRQFRPAGAATDCTLDMRILSSAPQGFEQDVQDFRRALLSHLSVVVVRVPPLREYSEDVPELLRYYVDMLVDAENLPFRRFSVAAQNRLRNYPWPGNLGELRNMVGRLLMLGSEDEISLEEVEAELSTEAKETELLVQQDLLAMPLREAREQFERAYLQQQLMLCGGKVGQLAKRVGMERTHLYRKLRSLGVDFRQVMTED
ncbi:MAG: sigma-54 dependent transcriptional regulator [Gammaproteobacteria bacterium]|nr:sigma-54 dependent transcriptional regulator [Gammaproteobacteria bacterium]MDH3508019.1 sigma-54 dependent transcriptional regulator [Gammaproteobacteria bacterium]